MATGQTVPWEQAKAWLEARADTGALFPLMRNRSSLVATVQEQQ